MDSLHTIDCTDCRRPYKKVLVTQEQYDLLFNNGMSGWGYHARCDDCKYIDNIHERDNCCRGNSKYEVGKYHYMARMWRGVQHYIINITHVTKCFVTYEICDITAGWEEEGRWKQWVKCRKKIKPTNCIEFPSARDNWSKITYGDIDINTLYKVGRPRHME